MIVKILYQKKPGNGFPGVSYNTNKIDRNKGELMKVKNFGALQGLSNLRPQDYANYLRAISSLNKNVRKPQFHVAISGKGQLYSKEALTNIAEAWLKEMGYGSQPYILTYHKDTDNNHVHIVTTRIARDGAKIDSAFEKVRSQTAMSKVLGYEYALGYQFSTRAQFMMLLEQADYPGLDPPFELVDKHIEEYQKHPERIASLKSLLLKNRHRDDLSDYLQNNHQIDLIMHASEGKRPYGYSIIDHHTKMVYKGSEVLKLNELLVGDKNNAVIIPEEYNSAKQEKEFQPQTHIQSIWIADDVDDQQIHGMRRRRQQKARTNTR